MKAYNVVPGSRRDVSRLEAIKSIQAEERSGYIRECVRRLRICLVEGRVSLLTPSQLGRGRCGRWRNALVEEAQRRPSTSRMGNRASVQPILALGLIQEVRYGDVIAREPPAGLVLAGVVERSRVVPLAQALLGGWEAEAGPQMRWCSWRRVHIYISLLAAVQPGPGRSDRVTALS